MMISTYIYRASFALTCIFFGGATYVTNIKELGGKDTKYLAPIAPIIVVGLYIVLMLVLNENQSNKGKMITGIITMLITGIGFFALLQA